jgi:hypothetical protein
MWYRTRGYSQVCGLEQEVTHMYVE